MICLKIASYEFPDDLYYDGHHCWARVEGDLVVTGITDFAQKLAGDIVYVEIPSKGRKVEQGAPYASMESGKWVGRLYAPVSGSIASVNESLEEDTSLVNSSPYGDGWVAKIKPNDLGQLASLMKAGPQLEKFIQDEIARIEKEKAAKK